MLEVHPEVNAEALLREEGDLQLLDAGVEDEEVPPAVPVVPVLLGIHVAAVLVAVLPCDPDDPSPPAACIEEDDARCGLALHQRALLRGWIDLDEVEGATDAPVTGEQELFCVDTIPVAGCPAGSA